MNRHQTTTGNGRTKWCGRGPEMPTLLARAGLVPRARVNRHGRRMRVNANLISEAKEQAMKACGFVSVDVERGVGIRMVPYETTAYLDRLDRRDGTW